MNVTRTSKLLASGIAGALALGATACTSAGAPSPRGSSTTSAAATTLPSVSIPDHEAIVFYRVDDAREHSAPFAIAPDGSGEIALPVDVLGGVWSPDGSTLAFPWGDWDARTIRPALVRADGSGFRLLDAYPTRRMQMFPVAWSPDGSRLFVTTGGQDATPDPADIGLYTMRAADGGDLRVVLPGAGFNDIVHVSPDGARVLVKRTANNDERTLYVVNADGTGMVQIDPPDTNPTDLDFWDGASEGWSPNGSAIAFTALVESADSTAMFVIKPDGKGLQRIVPTTVGAVTVAWSPDGSVIAFTSRYRTQPQVWVVHPDGSGLKKLTDGADGSTSVAPVWSPDGKKLLFQRQLNGEVTLWTMDADGAHQRQLAPTPLARDYVGGYAWWPARSE